MSAVQASKAENYAWACSLLQVAMEKGTYGILSFSMQNGIIGNVKTETSIKAPVDITQAKK